jgi:hypothetical protein
VIISSKERPIRELLELTEAFAGDKENGDGYDITAMGSH